MKKVDITFLPSVKDNYFDDKLTVTIEKVKIKTGDNRPYSVFTPFKKKWIENFKLDLLDIEFFNS